MKQIKIVFFDIDGTLVDHAIGRISPRTYETLARLRERGVLLCLATGRPPLVLPDFGEFQFDAYCTFNGSLCYTKEKTIYTHPLAQADVRKVLDNAAALGLPVCVATRDRMAANGIGKDLQDYYRLANRELTVAEDFDSVSQGDVYQLMIGCRPGDHEALARGTAGVKLAVAWERAVDVIPASGGKGTAIEKILRHFSLEPSQAMAFGDGCNDIEMLQAVGTGVAMGNGAQALKAVADDICDHVSNDGIYRYCVHHGLI